jgi:hypothetical protein
MNEQKRSEVFVHLYDGWGLKQSLANELADLFITDFGNFCVKMCDTFTKTVAANLINHYYKIKIK